jgi:kinesin family member C2/C3
MFVHIAPEPDAVSESISTLKFAERVATVELGAAKSNKEGAEVKELKEQVNSPLNFAVLLISLG